MKLPVAVWLQMHAMEYGMQRISTDTNIQLFIFLETLYMQSCSINMQLKVTVNNLQKCDMFVYRTSL